MNPHVSEARSVAIVGGYGVVGSQIASLLAARDPEIELLIAGRDTARAAALADTLPRAQAMALDLNDRDPLRGLPRPPELVLCAANDQHDNLLRACVDRGIALIDITRWTARIQDALRTLPATSGAQAPVVLASSWMASVPATLAAHAARDMPRVTSVEIDILYALADRAGPDSVAYLDRLATPFEAMVNGLWSRRRPFVESARVAFDGAGRARTYRLDTPDQMTLPAITGAGSVTARIAFDDPWATGSLAFLVRSGIWRLVSGPRFAGLRRRMLYNPGEGGHHRVRIRLSGRDAQGVDRVREVALDDPAGQTHLTAVGAVIQIERLLGLRGHERATVPMGAQYAEAVTDGALALETLRSCGVGVSGVDAAGGADSEPEQQAA